MKNPYLMSMAFSHEVYSNEDTEYVSYVPSKNPYLCHGWLKDAASKLKQKAYNNKYYQKNKELWKTKYYKYEKKGRQAAEDVKNTVSKITSKADKFSSNVYNQAAKVLSKNKDTGSVYETVETTPSTPHTFNPVQEYLVEYYFRDKKKYKLAKNVVMGAAGIIGGVSAISVGAITANPLAIGAGIGMASIGISNSVQAGKSIVESVKADMNAARIEANKKNEPIDPKSGFHLNTKNQTDEESLKDVNAAFKNLDMGTKNNCVLCSITYEMRLRGYDVTANLADDGYTIYDIQRWFPDSKPDIIPPSDSAVDELRDLCLSQGDGARGVVNVRWKDGGGHCMHYKVEGGQVIISDGQTGQVYGDPSVLDGWVNDIAVTRLDDKEPNYKALKEVCK